MSTRCQIFIVDESEGFGTIAEPFAMLYKHSDGYPQGEVGMVYFLAQFLQRFMKYRGWDPCYMPAQLLAEMIQESREDLRSMYDRMSKDRKDTMRDTWTKRKEEVANDFTGFGICREIHYDIEYAYVITKTGVRVYDTTEDKKGNYLPFEDRAQPHRWREITKPVHRKMIIEGRIPKMFKEAA